MATYFLKIPLRRWAEVYNEFTPEERAALHVAEVAASPHWREPGPIINATKLTPELRAKVQEYFPQAQEAAQ